ncbi:acyltransferase [Methylobacterium sp. Leaf466]|uniref:acyltransferase family protein n=1 Tax=Methylobacterium sp. Leaf466 TaxID=1736386 RepID=UPI000A8516C3|nr:acyltransferase [Methylobacterium sp. Leaf466]
MLRAIQVLRAMAALMVVMHHATVEAVILADRGGVAFAAIGVLPWAAGVDVFFVISGFIIVHAAAPLYGVRGGWRRFLAHRVARLVPLYWLASGLYLAVVLALPGLLSNGGRGLAEPGFVVASLLFWPVLDLDGRAQPLYSLGWTLQCEMAFYLLFAVALGWGRRAAVAWVAGALGLLAGLYVLVPDLPMPLAFWSAPIGLEFALGAAVGLARAEGLRLSLAPRLALALAGLALLSVAPEPDAVARPLAYGLPAMLLVAAAGLGASAGRATSSSLPWRFGIHLGDASYALYLVHPFVLRGLRGAITGLALPISPSASMAAMIVMAAAIALAVHRYVERPMVARARRWLDPAGTGTRPKPVDGP